MAAQPRKQALIDTAFALFNEHGYHATGIDWILKESGVSKATLYKYFVSKEALILAVLQQRHDQLIASTKEHLAQAAADDSPILALFDALHAWFQTDTFFGCNFIKASAEYAHVNDAIHTYSAEHKESMRALMLPYIPGENAALKAQISEQLMLLVEGAIVAAHVHNNKQSAKTAKAVAGILLAKYLSQ